MVVSATPKVATNKTHSNSRHWTGTSLQVRLMQAKSFQIQITLMTLFLFQVYIFCSIHLKAPYSVTLKDTMFKCPAFGKDVCPYAILVTKCKGLAGDCPAFKKDCPFKNCKSVGEFVEKLTQMRDQMKDSTKGKEAAAAFFKELQAVNTTAQQKLGACPFNAYACPFSHDAEGKPISYPK